MVRKGDMKWEVYRADFLERDCAYQDRQHLMGPLRKTFICFPVDGRYKEPESDFQPGDLTG